MFELFFSGYRTFWILVSFEIEQFFESVFLSKAFQVPISVFVNSTNNVVGDTYVKCRSLICDYVDIVMFSHHSI